VTAILGGAAAAVLFAIATLSASRSTRLIGALPALGGVMLVAFVIAIPVVLLTAGAIGPRPDALPWLILAGLGNVLGLLFEYFGLRTGKVGLVASMAAAEGAVAAVFAVLGGEVLAPMVGVGVVVVAVGVVMTAFAPDLGDALVPPRSRRAVLFGALAALAFGASLYSTGRIGATVSLGWAVVPARVMGLVALTIPLALTSKLRVTRRSTPFIVASGACEVGGFASFAWAAQGGIAVSSALAAQFASVSAVMAWLLFGERLSRLQWSGVATVAVGVVVLAIGAA
jgi:drug/metabolite transporter (DMT)-like permease